jgi:hypothetical protein
MLYDTANIMNLGAAHVGRHYVCDVAFRQKMIEAVSFVGHQEEVAPVRPQDFFDSLQMSNQIRLMLDVVAADYSRKALGDQRWQWVVNLRTSARIEADFDSSCSQLVGCQDIHVTDISSSYHWA